MQYLKESVFTNHTNWLLKVRIPGSQQTIDFPDRIVKGEKVNIGKKTAIIGGENVAKDAALVAKRLNAGMAVLYRRRVQDMPADEEEIKGGYDEGV